MFCSKCGTQNADGAAFCCGCGAPLGAAQAPVAPVPPVTPAAPVPPVAPVAPAPVMQTPVAPAVAPVQTPVAQAAPTEKKSNKKMVAAIAGGIAGVAVIAGGVGLGLHFSSDDYKYSKYVKQAEEFLADEEYEAALDAYEQAKEIKKLSKDDKKNLAEIYKGLVIEYAKDGKEKKARDAYEKLLEYGEADRKVMEALGLAAGDAEAVDTWGTATDAAVAEEVYETPAVEEVHEAPVVEEVVYPYPVSIDPVTGAPYDLGGMEIEIYQWWQNDNSITDAYKQARQEYRDWMQDTYNFVIREAPYGDWSNCVNDVVDYAVTGGDDTNRIFAVRQTNELMTAMKSGLLYDLSKLDCLDLNAEKYAKSGVSKTYRIGERVYAMYANGASPNSGMYFNKRILEQAGYYGDYIYDLQASGQWSWDNWLDIMRNVERDNDNDGIPDVYGCAQNDGLLVDSAVYSAGGSYIENVDGQFVVNLDNINTINGLDFAKRVLRECAAPHEMWDDFTWQFPYGYAAFMPGEVWYAGSYLYDMPDDWGFVCFPTPSGSNFVNVSNDNVYVIPACYDADRAWKIAFAYDLYTSDQIPGFEGYNESISQYYTQFRDTRAVDETIDYLINRSTKTSPIHNLVLGSDIANEVTWSINADADIYAVINNAKAKWADAINRANN